jgi:hypothetical protein
MSSASLPLALLLLAPAALAPEDELRAAPKEGSSLRKTFRERTTWRLESMEQVLDGAPLANPVPEMLGSVSRELVVADVVRKAGGAAPLELAREYESVRGQAQLDFEIDVEEQSFTLDLASELEGARVLFERAGAGAEAQAKAEPGASAPAGLLGGLREDLDLRAFVTEEGVAEGDWWKVDAAALADVLAPGGELGLALEKGAVRPEQLMVLDASEVVATTLCALSETAGELEGEVLCTWTETLERDGRKLAVIELDWQSASRGEAGPELARRLETAGLETMREDLTLDLAFSTKGEGQLVWDLAAGRARSLALELESQVEVAFAFTAQGAEAQFGFGLEARSTIEAGIEER